MGFAGTGIASSLKPDHAHPVCADRRSIRDLNKVVQFAYHHKFGLFFDFSPGHGAIFPTSLVDFVAITRYLDCMMMTRGLADRLEHRLQVVEA